MRNCAPGTPQASKADTIDATPPSSKPSRNASSPAGLPVPSSLYHWVRDGQQMIAWMPYFRWQTACGIVYSTWIMEASGSRSVYDLHSRADVRLKLHSWLPRRCVLPGQDFLTFSAGYHDSRRAQGFRASLCVPPLSLPTLDAASIHDTLGVSLCLHARIDCDNTHTLTTASLYIIFDVAQGRLRSTSSSLLPYTTYISTAR